MKPVILIEPNIPFVTRFLEKKRHETTSTKLNYYIIKTTVRLIGIRPYTSRIQVEIGRAIDLDTN